MRVMRKRTNPSANPAERPLRSVPGIFEGAGSHPTRQLVLRLDAMTYGGDAIGRADGKAVFVRGGIAGERVRAEIVEERGRFARARVAEVIEPSPDRVRPRCPHFGFESNSCGGCHWQHVDYAAQMRFKADVVREQFRRIGRIADVPVRDTIPSPDAWAYRNHAQFSVTPDGRLGFQAARSNRVVAIEECHVVQPEIAEWLKENRQVDRGMGRIEVRAGNAEGEKGREGEGETIAGSPASNFYVLQSSFRVSQGSFFQVNTSQIENLVDLVLRGLDVRGNETVLDAYCGIGLFTRFLAPIAGRVIGIDSSPSAIADARFNLARFENVELRQGLVEERLAEIGEPIDAAVVDPPRVGCGSQVIQALIGKQVNRLVYVSCDPSTLARDARQLLDGGYRLTEVQPVDMFPHTYHIECVARFTLR